MPLTGTNAAPRATEDGWAVGVPMMDDAKEVMIYASAELLDAIGSGGRYNVFQENRDRIEHIGRCKYETEQPRETDGRFMVTTEDFFERDWPDHDDASDAEDDEH